MKKKISCMLGVLALTTLMGFTAFAGERITSVTIRLTEEKVDPGVIYPIEISSGNESKYTIEEVTMTPEYDSWRPGGKTTITVVVVPTEDNYFVRNKTKIGVSGGRTSEVSTSIASNKITYRMNYNAKVQLPEPTNIYFDEYDEYIAQWDKVDNANYEVVVMTEDENGNWKNHKAETVTRPEIDLSRYATNGDVKFKVRSVAKNKDKSNVILSSPWVDSDDVSTPDWTNTVYGEFKGSGENTTFKTTSGENATGWQQINGNWYYFKPEDKGKAAIGWLNVGNEWYHFAENGIMNTGWLYDGGYYYYLNTNHDGSYGKMLTGWIQTGPAGPQYYLNTADITTSPYPHGAMYVNGQTPDGYYVDASGAWIH